MSSTDGSLLMTEHVANNSRIFKANESLSNTAKLLRAYMECSGIHCAKTISENLGINLRTIYRLKLDIAASCATGGTATSATTATDGTIETATCATGGTQPSRVEYTYFPLELEDRPESEVSPPKVPHSAAKPIDFRTMFADPAIEHGVEVQGGKLVLVNGTRTEWLSRFDDDENRLDLALVQAFGELQPNSGKGIKQQVERTLARIAGQKRDQDKRYDKAVKSNGKAAKSPAAKSEKLAEFRAVLAKSKEGAYVGGR